MCNSVLKLAYSFYNSNSNITRHFFVVLLVLALFLITYYKVNKLNYYN
jgi:hypothetical protein